MYYSKTPMNLNRLDESLSDNDRIMIPHNIFDCAEFDNSKLSNIDLSQQLREEEYVQSTPISPIKAASFLMNDQETPQNEVEFAVANNDNFVVEQLIDLLQSDSNVVQYEAASSMIELISTETARKVVELDGIFCLAKALESKEDSVRDECAKCICKLASVSPSIRDSVIVDEGLISLLYGLNSRMSDKSRNLFIAAISECLSNEVRPSSNACHILIPQLVSLLQNECNEFVINQICRCIVYLCSTSSSCIKAFIDYGVKARLTHLLTHQHEMAVTAALRAIRSLVLPKAPTNQSNFNPALVKQQPVTFRNHDSSERLSSVDSPREPSSLKKRATAVGNPKVNRSVDKRSSPSRYFSPNSTLAKQEEEIKDWTVTPLTSRISEKSYIKVCELDMITCQNVEMFKASEEDTNDREAEAGSAIIGQVGLRCIHCGRSPFAKAQFSTVYPGSIRLLPASLRHMAHKHFQSCESTPIQTRKRFHDLCLKKENTSNQYYFQKFCVELCTKVGVVNRQPQRSGLIVENLKNFSPSRQQKMSSPPRSIAPVTLFHPLNGITAKEITGLPSSTLNISMCNSSPMQNACVYHGSPITSTSSRNTSQKGVGKGYSFSVDRAENVQRLKENQGVDVIKETSNQLQSISNKGLESSMRTCPTHEDKSSPRMSTKDKNSTSTKTDKNTSEPSILPYFDYNELASKSDVVLPGDRNILTDYSFYAMCQFKSCAYSNVADGQRRGRGIVTRPAFDDNFAGLQCIHCVNGNQPRKFFFSKAERFSNSFSEMTTHLGKCKYCPPDIKSNLSILKKAKQSQQCKLPRGAQKHFFNKLWERLHGQQVLTPDTFQARCLARADEKELFNEYEYLVRKGIQIFCATKFDVSFWKASIRKLNIRVGQVGLRCIHCARSEMDTVDLDATIFTTKIENILLDAKLLHQRHSPKCSCAPVYIKETFKGKKPSITLESKKRCTDWAKNFGLFNDKNCVLYKQSDNEAPQLEDGKLSSLVSIGTNRYGLKHPESPDENISDDNDESSSTIVNATSLNKINQLCRVTIPPTVVSVTPSVSGAKRSHGDSNADNDDIHLNAKRQCAV